MSLLETTETPTESVADNNIQAEQPVIQTEADNILDARPDFLKPKFKTVNDQAKAYVELEKKLGSFIGAPTEYTSDIKDYTPDETFLELSLTAKELNMSNDGFNKLVGKYLEIQKRNEKAIEEINVANIQAEMSKLGDNAADLVSGVKTWANNHFNEEEMGYAKMIAKTAGGLKWLAKMKDMAGKAMVANQPKADIGISYEDDIDTQLADAVNSERYKTDIKYAEHINKKYIERYG